MKVVADFTSLYLFNIRLSAQSVLIYRVTILILKEPFLKKKYFIIWLLTASSCAIFFAHFNLAFYFCALLFVD